MRLHNALRLFALGLLAFGLYAQTPPAQGGQGADRQQNETSMAGCLTKDATGGYTLADERTRRQDRCNRPLRPGKTFRQPQGNFDRDDQDGQRQVRLHRHQDPARRRGVQGPGSISSTFPPTVARRAWTTLNLQLCSTDLP